MCCRCLPNLRVRHHHSPDLDVIEPDPSSRVGSAASIPDPLRFYAGEDKDGGIRALMKEEVPPPDLGPSLHVCWQEKALAAHARHRDNPACALYTRSTEKSSRERRIRHRVLSPPLWGRARGEGGAQCPT